MAQANSSTFPSGRDSRSRGLQHPYLPSQTRRLPGVPRAACARDVPWDAEKVRVRPSLRAGCSPGRRESARVGGGSRPGGPPRTAGSSLVTPSSPRRKCPQIETKAQSWLRLLLGDFIVPARGPTPEARPGHGGRGRGLPEDPLPPTAPPALCLCLCLETRGQPLCQERVSRFPRNDPLSFKTAVFLFSFLFVTILIAPKPPGRRGQLPVRLLDGRASGF